MDVLLLSVPPQDRFDNPLVERNPRAIAKWLDQLPLLNPAETIMQLLNALGPLNRQEFPDKDRLRILDLYREAVNGVFNAFTLRALRQVPLAAARREQIRLAVTQLCLELAGGYKSLVLPAYQQGRSPAQEPALLLAAYCAMQQLIHALLHCFRIYESVPPRVYLEIHQLYAWVEAAGVCEEPIGLGRDTVTVGALYRRALLLCCADPARLSEDEVLRVYALLTHYQAHSRIVPGRCVPPFEGQFAFDLYADAPPRPCAKYDAQGHSSQPRLLDARDVAAAVRTHTQSESTTTADEERRLLRMLLPHLESTPQRVQPRQNKQQKALIATGIAGIHYYLSDPRRLKQDVSQATQGIAVQEIDVVTNDIDHHSLDSWVIGNESETGYLLSCTRRQTPVRVGELLGLLVQERAETIAALELVVVRWMRTSAEGGLEAGVERINGAAAAVQCRLLSDATTSRQCLFLPSSSRQDRHATLLAPKRFYSRGQRLHVEVGGKPIIVEAGHLVMDTSCFDRFVFHAQGDGGDVPT